MSPETLRKPRAPEVPHTSREELTRILDEQRKEVDWWSDYPAMAKDADIVQMVAEGRAIEIPDEGEGYRISAKVPRRFRVLLPEVGSVLEEVARRWLEALRQRGIDSSEIFLVISSLGRTVEYQKELMARGYPAAEDSTHTKLGAFDVAIDWFKKNRPDVLQVLDEVLAAEVKAGRINWIKEPTIGAYHVAYNPLAEERAEAGQERRVA